jgi:nicotinamidase-related amidase
MFNQYTLVVVDMQPFYTTDTATISSVAREVSLARQRNNHVIFLTVPYLSPLQDKPFKPTYPEILDQVEGYQQDHWQESEKLFQDGSRNVLNACAWKHFPSNRFRVCGVNTDLCVLDTVKGLLAYPTVEAIEVVKDACHTTNEETDNIKVWKLFPANPRLSLIESGATVSPLVSLKSDEQSAA